MQPCHNERLEALSAYAASFRNLASSRASRCCACYIPESVNVCPLNRPLNRSDGTAKVADVGMVR